MKNIQKIQSAVLVIILLLTLHNTYKIHSVKDTSSVEQDMSAFAEGINNNATEIQTLETNMQTMVDFVNTKFESLKSSDASE